MISRRSREYVKIASVIVLVLFVSLVYIKSIYATDTCDTDKALCNTDQALSLPLALSAIPEPSVSTPDWMNIRATFTYSISTRGTITADLSEFKQQANATLNDSKGWSRLGIQFNEVASGGNFVLYLSEASQVPSFAPTVCSELWSCSVGSSVIINQDRWLGATSAWNNGGGNLRDYRHMVINHEVGHWLGHGHSQCSGAGQLAPVMQQQSIDLQGCTFNPWPLDDELWTSKL